MWLSLRNLVQIVRERPWASKRQPINYKRCCTDRLNSHRMSSHHADERRLSAFDPKQQTRGFA